MIFSKKSEKKKLPLTLGVTVGALAVIGAMSIKDKACSAVTGVKSKMKAMLKKKPMDSVFSDCDTEF